MCKRNKKAKWMVIFLPACFLVIFSLVANSSFKYTADKISVMDDFVVSSSSFTADGSTTLTGSAATTDPTTKQDFSTCLLNRAASIGIVTASGLPAKSIIDLNTIYGEINDAFKATQKSLSIA